MYRVDHQKQNRRRHHRVWLVVGLIMIALIGAAVIFIRDQLKPHSSVTQAKAVTTKVAYDTKTNHYSEPDFGIDLPSDWQLVPKPAGPYNLYRWQTKDGQQMDIYEDTVPVNFAVNRVLVVEGQIDHLALDGGASDNCSTFTKNLSPAPNQVGVPAKWQGVSFLCDQFNKQRDVIGTSSMDGVNTVILKPPVAGPGHKFFFTYTNHSTNPDFALFYNALQSLRMQ